MQDAPLATKNMRIYVYNLERLPLTKLRSKVGSTTKNGGKTGEIEVVGRRRTS
jgi:hypothetical protein